ncbi:MAG: Gfo/Idh/MocA family oxidoreductase [Spirochaetaceae bacterium]|nr:Gfo/Idh/MocA family oxidoreductase [Spirochaetaceae bacterium]
MGALRIAVIGAGYMGRKHIRYLAASEECRLAAVVDPDAAAEQAAREHGARYCRGVDELLSGEPIDGVIVASPTGLHEEVALRCIGAGVPVLVEKPICATVESAERLIRAAEQAGVALLVGHHRRYNPAAAAAKRLFDEGVVGRLVGVSTIWCMCKPDSYFKAAWRRQPGGGPVLTNLIHEIDLLRYLAGDIAEVAGFTANAVRGFATEDSAAFTLRFTGGALASVVMSDSAPSPWSWEQASGESPQFPVNEQNPVRFFGTEAALEFPRLVVWRHRGRKSWTSPLAAERVSVPGGDAFALQLSHFAAVVRDGAAPLVTGREGQRTLAATLALFEAARTGRSVALAPAG